MKSHSLVFLLSASALTAATPSLPSFTETLPDPPTLSLSEAAKSGQLPAVGPQPPAARWFREAVVGRTRFISRMPVLEPAKEIDPNMPIVAPKPGIDFKMIVKQPGVESVK